MNDVPLVVDLDGTLIQSDLLLETALTFVKHKPHLFLRPVAWALAGKAKLKSKLAEVSEPTFDAATLPYNPAILTFLAAQKTAGRKIFLATASHHSLAKKIVDHLQLFDGFFASDEDINLSADRKRDFLVSQYGERGFDYIGNSMDDIVVWQSSRKRYVADAERGVLRKTKKSGDALEVLSEKNVSIKAYIKAFRLHQWMKNALIVVPLLAAHKISDSDLLIQAIFAFLFFGFCASSVYILNDLLDLGDDRHHKTKRFRPFASGLLSIRTGIILFPLLLLMAFIGAWILLPLNFIFVLAAYYALTLTYSLDLKRRMAIDVIVLAVLYTMRIVAGAAAFELPLTSWILAFSMFIFLSLALVKRFAELADARKVGKTGQTRGRGYYPSDLEMISSLGAASGYLSVMVLALYIHDPATVMLYAHPQLIWLACPLLLFWVTRIWMLTHRGQMNDDPVVFAIKDRVSVVTGFLLALVFWIAA
jgi:4-hydroxybenzoate polyprenyltransferase